MSNPKRSVPHHLSQITPSQGRGTTPQNVRKADETIQLVLIQALVENRMSTVKQLTASSMRGNNLQLEVFHSSLSVLGIFIIQSLPPHPHQ